MKPTKRRTLTSSTTTGPPAVTLSPYLLFLLLPNPFASTDAATLSSSSSSSSSCQPHQATLTFVLQTDAQSTVDNSFRIVDASSDGVLLAENVDSNDAVISRSICVDTARSPLGQDEDANDETAAATLAAPTPRCYRLHLHDDYGDGLTLPHSQSGGSPGGWLLQWNGEEVARHAPPSCLPEDATGTYNTCAEEFGFEFCAVRVCDSGADGGAAGVAVTNLPGSQCSLAPRTCPSVSSSSSLGTSDGSSMADVVANSSSPGNAVVSVVVETDSYSDDFSWEVRKSFKSNALEKSGEWLMGGGKAVLDEETKKVLLAAGAGGGRSEEEENEPTLADNESFLSTTCQPDDLASSSTCYDLRAYDSYGDGLGCGADGSISFSLTSPSEPDAPIVSLLQADDNFARLQRDEVLVDGNDKKTRLACTNREGLTKWSYCAIRICRDGDVIRLPGNECGFGTEVLLDPDADGTIRPFVTDGALSALSGEGMVTLAEEFAPQEMNEELDQEQGEEQDDGDLTKAEIFAAEEDPQFMTIALNGDGFGFNSQSLALNDSEQDEDEETKDKNKKEKDDQEEELSLAEQMDARDPFRYQGQDLQGQSADKDEDERNKKDKQDQKDKKDKQDKFDQLRPQSQAFDNNPTDNDKKEKKDKNKNKNEMQTQSHQFTQTLTPQTQTVHLEPFFSNLLPTTSPHTLKYSHPKTLSNAIAAYVMNYLRVNIEGWRGDNPPIDMDLICSKDKKDFGSLQNGIKVWVVKCEGETLFSASGPLPKKSLMNDLVHQAFAGDFHEEFLEFMYPTYKEEKMQSKKEMKEEMKLKKEQMKLQSEIVGGFDVDEEEEEKRNDKFLKQQKREKLQLQRQKEKEKREKQQKRKKQMEERQRKKEARDDKKERIQERQRQRERNKEEKRNKKTKEVKDRSGRLLRSRST